MNEEEIRALVNTEYEFFCGPQGIDFDQETAEKLRKIFEYQGIRKDDNETTPDIAEPGIFPTRELVDRISDINCEADFVGEVLNFVDYSESEKSEINGQEIDRKIKWINETYEAVYQIYAIRNYIRTEIIRYYAFMKKEPSIHDIEIQELLRSSIEDYDREIPNNCWYPIRIRIQRVLKKFRDATAHTASGAKLLFLDKTGTLSKILMLIDENNEKYKKQNEENKKDVISKYKYQKGIREVLEEFRINMPGTIGHLLWMIYYIGELLYFHVSENTEDGKKCRYTLKSTKNDQPDYIRDVTFRFDEGTLDRMFRDFLKMTEEWRGELGYASDDMRIYFATLPRRSDIRNQIKRISGILKQDRIVNKVIFPDSSSGGGNIGENGSGKGDEKGTCFSILTNIKNSWIAFSGNKTVTIGNTKIPLWDYCRNILRIRCRNNNFKFINPREYGYSEYRWTSSGTKKVMTYFTADSKRAGYKQKYKANFPARMYSCSERRLIHKCRKGKGYVIISKMAPCYICERVLKDYNITYYPSGSYKGLADGTFDRIADRLDQIP